jgi:serine/threonine-protein kinase
MTVPAPSLTELRSEVPAALADVVQRCLEKDPDNRFPTINNLAAALKPFVDVSHRSLPFADTLDEGSMRPSPFSASAPEQQVRTGGEFAGTNGGGPSAAPSRARTWAAIGLASILVAMAAAVWHRGTPAQPVAATGPAATTYHVSVHTNPVTARIRFDDEGPTSGPFVRDLPRDGQPHTLVVEADGFESREASFRDVAPPLEVTLKALWQQAPAGEPPPQAAPAPSSEVVPVPPATTTPTRRDPRPKSTAAQVSAAQSPSPSPAAATPTAVPRTTNDSPIVR